MRISVAICIAATLVAGCFPALAQDAPKKPGAANVGGGGQNPAAQFWFGVAVENIPPAFAKQFKLRPEQGVIVVAVLPGSPAEKAGLKADDLLIELNGKPLTTQEELARAANMVRNVEVDTGKGSSLVAPSDIAYLREGNRVTAHIVPEPRPSSMAVTGANARSFTLGAGTSSGIEVRNYTLPNGSTVYVGPGYQVDSHSQSTNMRVLRDAVGKGDTLVLTQETDDAGNLKNMISDGKNSYTVEPGNLDKLPVNLRPLAQQMLAGQAGVAGKAEPLTTDDRLKILEQQNQELKKKLDQLEQLLIQNAPKAPAAQQK